MRAPDIQGALREALRIGGEVTGAALHGVEAAGREVLSVAGLEPQKVRGRLAEPFPASVQHLAEDVVAAGRENRDLVIGLVRSEAEKAWHRLGDGFTQVGVLLEMLERRVRDLEAEPVAESPAAEEHAPRTAVVRVEVDEEAAPEAEAEPAPAEGLRAPEPAPEETVQPNPAKKTAAPRTGPKKTAAKKAAAKKTATPKTVAEKAAVKKPAAGNGTAKKAAAKKQAEKQPEKRPAAKKATAVPPPAASAGETQATPSAPLPGGSRD